METLQNVSNCHKSEKSPNKNDLPYYIVVLVNLRAPWAGLKPFRREIEVFIFHVC